MTVEQQVLIPPIPNHAAAARPNSDQTERPSHDANQRGTAGNEGKGELAMRLSVFMPVFNHFLGVAG